MKLFLHKMFGGGGGLETSTFSITSTIVYYKYNYIVKFNQTSHSAMVWNKKQKQFSIL